MAEVGTDCRDYGANTMADHIGKLSKWGWRLWRIGTQGADGVCKLAERMSHSTQEVAGMVASIRANVTETLKPRSGVSGAERTPGYCPASGQVGRGIDVPQNAGVLARYPVNAGTMGFDDGLGPLVAR